MSKRDFQGEYDEIRDKSSRLFARNPGAYSQLAKYGKRLIKIRKEAESAGVSIIRRERGWTKKGS